MTTLFAVMSRRALTRGTASHGPVYRIRTVLWQPGFRTLARDRTLAVEEHLSVRLPARKRWSQLADVLIEHGTGAPRAAETGASHPGALVVAVHDGSRCWMRLGAGGTVLALEAAVPGDPEESWGTLASLAHAWLVAGLPAEEFGSVGPAVNGASVAPYAVHSGVGLAVLQPPEPVPR
ncbi:hypothetical protein [Streptomyces coeruleorubidus]|uniref:hypothetical protein n=1 Tax=Streptomyces coeruleorubidus TaxID=116188 RepID=UPI00339DBAC3